MNAHDTERMSGLLEAEGYSLATSPEEAGVILVNTCAVRPKAESKAYSAIGRLRKLKNEHPPTIIGVCGCIAQSEGEKIFARMPYVDFVLGPRSLGELRRLIRQVERQRVRAACLDDTSISGKLPIKRAHPYRAWVTIMEGCDNCCTYCIVPYVRGREDSRPLSDILGEVCGLAREGYKEVTFLGQNVNSYGRGLADRANLARLLELAAEVPGIERLRFVTSHPKDLSYELMQVMANIPQVCEHLHLPLQSGSDKVLRAMNRKYAGADYLEKLRLLRELIPEISITTDVMVGFPGETEEDFAQTLEVVEAAQFDTLFSFIYSDRPHTVSAGMGNKIPREIAQPRFMRLLELQDRITKEHQARQLGKTEQVLVEGKNQRLPEYQDHISDDPGSHDHGVQLTGRTRGNRLVHFSGLEGLLGKLVWVKITRASQHCLMGELHPSQK